MPPSNSSVKKSLGPYAKFCGVRWKVRYIILTLWKIPGATRDGRSTRVKQLRLTANGSLKKDLLTERTNWLSPVPQWVLDTSLLPLLHCQSHTHTRHNRLCAASNTKLGARAECSVDNDNLVITSLNITYLE